MPAKYRFFLCIVPAAAALLTLAACNGGGDSDFGGNGKVSVGVTDAPVDGANRVVVEFTGITLKPQGGQEIVFEFDSPQQIDLLNFQGDEFEPLLIAETVPAGPYNFMRLHVEDNDCASLPPGSNPPGSFIELSNGSIEPLFIPSGSESGLKLVSGFTIAAGGLTEFTIDFDLRKSVVKPTGQSCHFLKPALRLVDNAEVGHIAGTVSSAQLVGANCTPADQPAAVYLFAGSGVTPDDVDSVPPNPVTSGFVQLNPATGVFQYEIGFVLAGSYTLALTCDADIDNPETDDAGVAFVSTKDVTVTAEQTTQANF